MGKLISEGEFEAEGMTFHYRYYRDGRLPNSRGYNCYIEYYYGRRIVEYDHGYGLEHAINLAKIEVGIIKKNMEEQTSRKKV